MKKRKIRMLNPCLQDAVCGSGRVNSQAVNDISKAVMVTWAELMIRGKRANRRDAPEKLQSPVESASQPGRWDGVGIQPSAKRSTHSTSERKVDRRDQTRVGSKSTNDGNEPENGRPESSGDRQGGSDASTNGFPSVSTSEDAAKAASERVSKGDLSIPRRALAGAASPGTSSQERARDPDPGGTDRGKNLAGVQEDIMEEWVADHKGEQAALVGSRIWSVAEAVEAITQEVRKRATISSQLRL